jgi:hypothetical protein
MPTSAATKYQTFIEDLANELHNLFGTTDTLKLALTNTAPNVATHIGLADISEISAGNGYTAGGADTQNDGTRSGGILTVTGVDITWTATGGSIGPFRYAVLYNDTSTGDRVIQYWDYSASITLLAGDTFLANFGASMLTAT